MKRAKKLKPIIHIFDEQNEIEGMFDLDGNCLGAWCLNDANWRNEYFNGFIEALGYEITASNEDDYEIFLAKLRAEFSISEDYEEA
jgi:hypothetical protein